MLTTFQPELEWFQKIFQKFSSVSKNLAENIKISDVSEHLKVVFKKRDF